MENILYFKNEAEHFEQALPIGNGRLGAMVYGKTDVEKISLNEDTLWSGTGKRNPVPESPKESYKKARQLVLDGKITEAQEELAKNFHSMWSQVYMPLGNLRIDFDHKNITEYLRALDFSSGICKVSYKSDGVEYTREIFSSYPDDIIALKLSSDKEKALSFSLFTEIQLKVLDIDLKNNIFVVRGCCPSNGCIYPFVQKEPVVYTGETGIGFTLAVKIECDGEVSENGGIVNVHNASEAILYVSVKTSFNGYDKNPHTHGKNHTENALKAVSGLSLKKYSAIRNRHMADFSLLYNRVHFNLNHEKPDGDILSRLENFDGNDLGLYELLFGYGRYLTISSSRQGSQATNLQSIWNEKICPPWSSNYTININTQMNYWPTFSANLAECAGPFVDLAERLRESGRQTAIDYYGARGFVSHHNTDLWAMTNPVGYKNAGFSCVYAFWNMSSGWIGCQLYDMYEYTLDKKFLAKVYPVIRDASLFYADIIFKDDEGYMVCPSTSPENTYTRGDATDLSLSKTTTMTASILKELFTRYLKASEILGICDEITKRVSEILPELYPIKISTDGRIMEWAYDETETEVHHRHVSHLYSLYPGNHITLSGTPELAEACKKSLLARGDDGTGWSLSWKVSLWAYLKDGNHALELLKNQLRLAPITDTVNYSGGGGVYPNMLAAHPPFQIDANFGSTDAICNMLLQSEIGCIDLLPALPDVWQNGSISGIVAKGNIEVGITWKNKKVASFTLRAAHSCEVCVRYNGMEEEISLKAGEITEIQVI